MGDVPGVVFPCGMIYRPESDELRLYYGAADSCVALATASLSKSSPLSWNMAKRTRPIFRSEAATLPAPATTPRHLLEPASSAASAELERYGVVARGHLTLAVPGVGVAELIHRFPVTRFRWCPLVR